MTDIIPPGSRACMSDMMTISGSFSSSSTFAESFQKCIRSMEIKRPGYGLHPNDKWLESLQPVGPDRTKRKTLERAAGPWESVVPAREDGRGGNEAGRGP